MKTIVHFVATVVTLSIMLTGCGEGQQQPEAQQPHTRITPSDLAGKLPAALSVEKVEYAPTSSGVERVALYVTVVPDLNRSQLQDALSDAARTTRTLSQAGAVMVLGYRKGDDPDVVGVFSAGQVIYAPQGRWEDASSSVPESQWSPTVELADSYFTRQKAATTVSGEVRLQPGKLSSQIKLSNAPDAWEDSRTVAVVPAGTRVEILDSMEFPLGSSRMIRYKIRIKEDPDGGKEGWVFEQSVKPERNP